MTPTATAIDGKEVQQFSSGTSGTWSTNCGALYIDATCTTLYNSSIHSTYAMVYLKAYNKTATGSVIRGSDVGTVTVTGVLPLDPSWNFELEPDKRGVLLNKLRNGGANGRMLGTGELVDDYKLVFENRWRSQYLELRTFVKDHYPMLTFKYADKWQGTSYIYRADSSVKSKVAGYNKVNMELVIVRVE